MNLLPDGDRDGQEHAKDRKVTQMSCNPKSRECFIGSHRKCSGEVPHLSTLPTPCECECHARDRELVAA